MKITTDNPGRAVEIEISDERLLQLFTDVAALKAEFHLACRVGLALLAGVTSTLAALIVIL